MEGYSVDVAKGAVEALDLTTQNPYDVVFLDLRLQDGNGLDVLKAILGARPQTNVVIMTGFGGVESAIAAFKAGAKEYLLKPFKIEAIVDLAKRLDEG
jgi:DNA-binding NtrC family response regulator